jgi:hypothetical protein
MTIKQGDIVASEGRIKTLQDGRDRFIEFEAALVLEIDDEGITVNPVGKNAVLLCQEDDLVVAKAATAPAKPAPSLKGVVKAESAETSAPKRRAKPPARRRRTS